MSAGITDRDSLVYANKHGIPWHKLGTPLHGNTSALEALPLAFARQDGQPGEWEAELAPLVAIDSNGNIIGKSPNRLAIVRRDTQDVLGEVSERYALRGPRAFCEFLDSLRPEGVVVDVLGSLHGGRKLWCSLNIGENWTVKRADGRLETYKTQLLAKTGVDGLTGYDFYMSDTRAVCQNTIQAAIRSGEQLGRIIKHTANVDNRLAQARLAILTALGQVDAHAEILTQLDREHMNRHEFVQFSLALLMGKSEDPSKARDESVKAMQDAVDRIKTRTENAIAELVGTFEQGIGNNGQTRYDALNAVTEYVDHARNLARKGKATAEKLMKAGESSIFGTGSERKARALNLLTRW